MRGTTEKQAPTLPVQWVYDEVIHSQKGDSDMTREEAIKILEQRFDSSCRNNLFQNVEKLDYEDALWMAISALRSTPHPGKPLTLEQLREMDGQPVWVEFIRHPDGTPIEPLWMLVNCREKRLVTDIEYVDWNIKGWLAYSYPPAHTDRSKWKPCEHCKSAEYPPQKFGAHQFPVVGNEIYFYDTEYGWEGEEIKHCPWCGRPLTKEAWAELERRLRG